MNLKGPAGWNDLFLKPAGDIESTIVMGETFLSASSAVATNDPKDAELSAVVPARWKKDWLPRDIGEATQVGDAPHPSPERLARKTIRSFAEDVEVSGDVISCLSDLLATNEHGGRSYPSPGRLYPVEGFVCSATGWTVWFDSFARAHRIESANKLWQSTRGSDLGSSKATTCTVLAINMPRISRKYLSRGIRYALIEAGAIAMRLEIELRMRGIESFWIGGFDDSRVSVALEPDASGLIRPILIMAHGKPVPTPCNPA